MEYVRKRLSELKPYENNPRVNDEAVDDVAESIRQCLLMCDKEVIEV